MKKILISFMMMLAYEAQAQTCIPTPDCAGLGYTATSCSGAFLRCPFDTTKMFCASGGGGSSSGGGATPESGGCLVGMIYYSDGSCSQYRETGKNAVGVVVRDNKLIMSADLPTSIPWAVDSVDISGLTNYIDGTVVKGDYNGKANTATIVAHYGASASNNAAVLCYNYAPSGMSGTKNQWYLPAAGEFYDYVAGNYEVLSKAFSKIGINMSSNYWSSSAYNIYSAWRVSPYDGNMETSGKSGSRLVSCFLAL